MPEVERDQTRADTAMRQEPVAPWLHTVFVVAVLGLWVVYGAMRWKLPPTLMPHSITYMSSILMEYLLVGTTIAGLYRRREFLVRVFGLPREWRVGRDVAEGFVVYLLGLGLMAVVSVAIAPLHLAQAKDLVQKMAPRSAAELALWVLVSATAGLCEEFLFRGYLLRQLLHWSGSTALAVGATSLLFGCMHFYEGVGPVVEIIALGALFAVVAVRRGNLRSVVVAHFLQDAITGYALYRHLLG